MEPTQPPPPAPAPPVVGAGLVDLFSRDRPRAGTALLGLSTALLLLCLWAAWAGSRAPKADPAAEAVPKLDEADAPKPKDPNRGDYILAAVVSGLGFLALAGVGSWLVVSLPPTDPARRAAEARGAVLAAGALLGVVLIVGGIAFFYRWSGSLAEWLDRGVRKEAKFVLAPFMAIVTGSALVFLAALPARAEERDNPTLRRLAYGTNLVLGVLLLFVGLVLLNLIVGPRLPNKLDTTSTGFYSLAPNTAELLGKLPEPVTAYAVLRDGRASDDMRRLLENCRSVGGGKFAATFVSAVADRTEYQKLRGKYPVLETNDFGVLLTVGADEKRHSFVREDEFTQRDPRTPGGGDGGAAFVGEARLLKELLFLVENEQKAVVYFTQSAGESALAEPGGEPVPPRASVQRLREYLSRNNLDVRPLRFDPKEPKVPDDAAVVAVIEPRQPVRDEHVAALRKYLSEPRPGGKKGKLIVLAGAALGAAPKLEVLRTGLEPLLAEYGVRMESRFVLSEETRELPAVAAVAAFSTAARRAKNPISMALGEKAAYMGALWREVGAAQQPGATGARPTTLLLTLPGRFSWLEDRFPQGTDLGRILAELEQSAPARAAKRFTDESRPVGVVVSDGDAGRMVVIGNGALVSDYSAEQSGGDAPGFELFGAAVDWLRDRPALSFNVESKRYQEFRFPPTADENRGLWLPLVLAVLSVFGLGSAVWVVRRRTA